MGHHPQELVANPPREVPGALATPPLLQKRATSLVLRCAFVGGVHQHVRIDDEHYRPSMAR